MISITARRTIAGLAVAGLSLGWAATPAWAHTNDSIRYASAKACADKNNGTVPCGPWRLDLHSGERMTLKDALVTPRDRTGKVNKFQAAPIAVSGDGQAVAYYRKSDGRVVVRELGGSVHVMPKIALPKGIGMDETRLALSQDGEHLAVEYYDEGEKQPTRVFDVADSAEPGEIPGSATFEGFSGDGSAILVSATTDDNVSELATYDVAGNELSRVVPPQVVANNTPRALSADGRSIALITGTVKKPLLKHYDMAADQVDGTIRIKLPSKNFPEMIDWTGEHEVTVHISDNGQTGGARMEILQIDTETGAIKLRDSYRVRKDAFSFASCGG